MKKSNLALWIFALSTVAVGVVNLYTRFHNPAMTETQLFLAFWRYYAAAIGVFVISAVVVIWLEVRK